MKKLLLILAVAFSACAQSQQDLVISKGGLQMLVVDKKYPLLKILLPGQPHSDRGIEVEFPEHVTGKNKQTNQPEHIYLATRGNDNKRTLPKWSRNGDTLIYESDLNNAIKVIAKAVVEKDGIAYSYTLTNHSNIDYENLQAVTCVKLYSVFSDNELERTYVHHDNGFDLLASEVASRIIPARYLVSYTWPINNIREEKDGEGIMRYYKSRKVDMPFIATLSHDKKWVAATYTKETGNVWTNPERSCHHTDPAVDLKAGETKMLKLKTYIFQGALDDLIHMLHQ